MNKTIISIIAIVAILFFSMLSFQFLKSQKVLPKKEHKKDNLKLVKVLPVKYQDVTSSIKSSGRVMSKSIVKLSAEVSGKILEGTVPFKKSQSFKKGDVLLKIYNENAKNLLKSKKSSFLQLISSILPDIKIDYSDSYEKWKTFFNQIDIDQPLPSLPTINSEKEKIYLANRNILSNYYNLVSDEITFSKYTIRAPFNGAFTQVNAEVGSFAGMGAPLANIISTEGLEIEAPVDVSKAKFVKVGDRVKIFLPDGEISFGTVVRKSNFVVESTQSINFFINFSNPSIVSGMYLKVEFGGIQINNSMELRRSNLVNNTKLWVVNQADSTLQLKSIDVLKKHTEKFVFNSLDEGELIVVSPMVKPHKGKKVIFQVINSEEEIL